MCKYEMEIIEGGQHTSSFQHTFDRHDTGPIIHRDWPMLSGNPAGQVTQSFFTRTRMDWKFEPETPGLVRKTPG